MSLKAIFTAFIAGSSWLPSSPFLKIVNRYVKEDIINISYYHYSILVPFYFGVWSALAIVIHGITGWSIRMSFFIVSLLSSMTIMGLITYFPVYEFTKKRLEEQYYYLFVTHLFVYNVVISTIYFLLRGTP